jgi:hypothetical protein
MPKRATSLLPLILNPCTCVNALDAAYLSRPRLADGTKRHSDIGHRMEPLHCVWQYNCDFSRSCENVGNALPG